MRSLLVLTSLLLLALPFAAAPAAATAPPQPCTERLFQAVAVCVFREDGNTCVRANVGPSYLLWECLERATASATVDDCVVIVPEGGDMGEKVCWDLRAECKVWYQRTTFIGTWTVCVVPPGEDGGPATESAFPPCMDRYWERDVVVGRVVSRSSCEYEVCLYHDGVCRPLLQ